VTAGLIALVREGALLALYLAAPLLIAGVIAGVVTSLIGLVTQVQDPAVALGARALAIGAALMVFAPSIGGQLKAFTARVWPLIAEVGEGGGPASAAGEGAPGPAPTATPSRPSAPPAGPAGPAGRGAGGG
jgi:flagellar biosynthetic protein FliQ